MLTSVPRHRNEIKTYRMFGDFFSDYDLQMSYDASGRTVLVRQSSGDISAMYYRDSVNRVFNRQFDNEINHTSMDNYYGYINDSDSPAFEMTSSGTVREKYLSLPGDVLLTIRPSATPAAAQATYSLQNVHGDSFATTNGSGIVLGTYIYDPYGNLVTSTPPNNMNGYSTYGWEGHAQKIDENTFLNETMEMGARTYIPAAGIFTTPDPVKGGNANAFTYPNDPINNSDLSGMRQNNGSSKSTNKNNPLSPEENRAVENRDAGRGYDSKAYKRAVKKGVKSLKFEGKRNIPKREELKRGAGKAVRDIGTKANVELILLDLFFPIKSVPGQPTGNVEI